MRQTGEYVRHDLTRPDAPGKEGQSPLNPKVQGSIPCANTTMLCLRHLTAYILWSVCRDPSHSRQLTAWRQDGPSRPWHPQKLWPARLRVGGRQLVPGLVDRDATSS